MRAIVIFLLVSISFIMRSQTKLVKLKFEETNSYCGGAAPTEEILESLKLKKPFAHKTIYVYSKGKCVDSLITDSLGIVSKKMKLGKYDLYLPWKHLKVAPEGLLSEYNLDCMQKEWLVADGVLGVSMKNVAFTNKRIGHHFCSYQYNCLKVRHIPPSAPK